MAQGWPHSTSPYHQGECAIQQRNGVRDKMEDVGRRMIGAHVDADRGEFYATLPFVILGSLDEDGQPWASIRSGVPGFAAFTSSSTLRIAGRSTSGDPLSGNLRVNRNVGVLGIDFAARRRHRANGLAESIDDSTDDSTIDIHIAQAFGNCPKYIQTRTWRRRQPERAASSVAGTTLTPPEVSLIARTDTFFIASAYGDAGKARNQGVDASHRGGKPGFVRVEDASTLLVPDFSGNSAFNTLGNLLLEPRCGLLFVDFDTGAVVQASARAQIIWDGPLVQEFQGALRAIRFHIDRFVHSRDALPLTWAFGEYSPFLAQTGAWT